MKGWDERRLVGTSAVLALIALALMSWSLLAPRPIPLVLFMTLGQLLGTVSFALFVLAVLLDLRRAKVLPKRDEP